MTTRAERRKRARERFQAIVRKRVQPHAAVLQRKVDQLVIIDDYGKADTGRWQKEVTYFWEHVVGLEGLINLECTRRLKERLKVEDKRPKKQESFLESLAKMFESPAQRIDGLAREAFNKYDPVADSRYIRDDLRNEAHAVLSEILREDIAEEAARDATPPDIGDMRGSEFEQQCAIELRANGWEVRVTQPGADQGVDLIATLEGVSVAIQCKGYKPTRTVGNKAVQEIVAGRLYHDADCAAVVTTSRYTKSAKRLAQTSGVLLLHYDELAHLETLL